MTHYLNAIDRQKQFLRRILFWLILVMGIFVIWYLLTGLDSFFDEETVYVPVSLNAAEIANYQLDAPGMVNPVNLSIIAEVLQDQNGSSGTSIISPNTPVVTGTPNPLGTLTPLVTTITTLIPNTTPDINPTLGVPTVAPSLIDSITSPVVPPEIATALPPVGEALPTLVDEAIPSLLPDLPLP